MMIDTNSGPQAALKFETAVSSDGTLELQIPSAAGERVVVFVIAETFSDLTASAESSLVFWDNPLDDEDWKNA
ncbi:MAG: hypothetical protein NT013_29860 [Planctomycetia bacterium]|nr:hypothetical protein [Planctomycetia bacterium]